MVLRRIFVGLLVFFFVTVSMAAFLVFAISNTFLSTSFYQEDLKDAGYEFLVDGTVKSLKNEDGLISQYFLEEELRAEVEEVFPMSLYQRTVDQVVEEVETLRDASDQPLTFRLSMYRESLLTLAHNLAFKIFETLPQCEADEIPQELSHGLPSCVPPEVSYNSVSGQLSSQFEKDIYSAVPEQGQFDMQSAFGEVGFVFLSFLLQLDTLKVFFYGVLLILLALIALIVYSPFASILLAEGLAFFVSGVVGIVVGYAFMVVPFIASSKLGDHYLSGSFHALLTSMLDLFRFEIHKGALVFLATGVILLSVRYFLNRR